MHVILHVHLNNVFTFTYVHNVLLCYRHSPQATSNQECELTLNEVNFTGTEISHGAYRKVFEVEYEGTLCAAREVQSSSICAQGVEQTSDKILQDSFLHKCQIWSKLHHPCIVQFIGLVS